MVRESKFLLNLDSNILNLINSNSSNSSSTIKFPIFNWLKSWLSMESKFSELLKGCSPEKQKLIYRVARTIAESDAEYSERPDLR